MTERLPPRLRALCQRWQQALHEATFPFEELLERTLHYQWEHSPTLQGYWKARGFDPHTAEDLSAVPGVPTDVFRHVTIVSNEAPTTRVFRTSGTTSGARGEHHHIDTSIYELSARQHFQKCVLQGRRTAHFIHVAFPSSTHPDSSLSHMLQDFGEHLGSDARSQDFYFDAATGIRGPALHARLLDAQNEGVPVILFGTAFGLADSLDALPPTALPAGSLIVQTGGFKGRREALAPEEFYQQLADHYGVSPGDIIAEYGMTELSSQLWSDLSVPALDAITSANRPLTPPPWCRVSAVDPQSLTPLPNGEPGLLRFLDLANLDSVVAIQTSDLGVVHEHGVTLLGRAPGSTPRGCSLAIEELRNIAQR